MVHTLFIAFSHSSDVQEGKVNPAYPLSLLDSVLYHLITS